MPLSLCFSVPQIDLVLFGIARGRCEFTDLMHLVCYAMQPNISLPGTCGLNLLKIDDLYTVENFIFC